MNPPLPTRLGKITKTKGINGEPLVYTVIDEDIFLAPSNDQKAFCLYKIRHSNGKDEFRIGYYMIAQRPRMKGKWAWGQFAPIMTAQEMSIIFDRAKTKGWI